jgi:hypothetical protein
MAETSGNVLTPKKQRVSRVLHPKRYKNPVANYVCFRDESGFKTFPLWQHWTCRDRSKIWLYFVALDGIGKDYWFSCRAWVERELTEILLTHQKTTVFTTPYLQDASPTFWQSEAGWGYMNIDGNQLLGEWFIQQKSTGIIYCSCGITCPIDLTYILQDFPVSWNRGSSIAYAVTQGLAYILYTTWNWMTFLLNRKLRRTFAGRKKSSCLQRCIHAKPIAKSRRGVGWLHLKSPAVARLLHIIRMFRHRISKWGVGWLHLRSLAVERLLSWNPMCKHENRFGHDAA